jgi:signal peptidase II
MTVRTRILFTIVIAFLCASCDQASKQIAKSALESGGTLSYFSGVLRLSYTENPGGALSFGANFSDNTRFGIFVIGTVILLLLLLLYLARAKRTGTMHIVALGLILGGGIGNLLDRLFHGYVIDFLSIGIGNIRTTIFNLADVAVLAGIGIVIVLVPMYQDQNQKFNKPLR